MFKSLTFATAALLTVFILPLSASAKGQSPNPGAAITHAIFDSVFQLYEVRNRHDGNRRNQGHRAGNHRRNSSDYQHSPNYRYSGNSNGRSGNRYALAHALTDYISYSLNHHNSRRGYGHNQRISVYVNPSKINLGKRVNYSNSYRYNTSYGYGYGSGSRSGYDNCRKFKSKVRIDGHGEKVKGTACRDYRGSWEIVDLNY